MMTQFDYLGYAIDCDDALLTTIISQRTSACSDFDCLEGVLILGSVLGNVYSHSGIVLVADSGTVRGTVASEKLVVAGAIYGDVFARVEVVLLAEAEIHGNIFCPGQIHLADDCFISGRILKANRTIEQFAAYQRQA